MTVRNLMEKLEKCPPNMRAFACDSTGNMVEVNHAEVLPGDDEVCHEKQSEDVLLIS